MIRVIAVIPVSTPVSLLVGVTTMVVLVVYVLCFCRVSVLGRSVAVRVFGFVVVMCVFVRGFGLRGGVCRSVSVVLREFGLRLG